jgi:putative chitinase
MTLEELMQATGAKQSDAEKYLEPLIETMELSEIDTPKKQAAFLATISVESARLSAVEEGLYYSSPERLAKIFFKVFGGDPARAEPYAKNPSGLSKILYNGYHGRGLIQLTHDYNYRACGQALGVDFLANPELLTTPKYAAMSAGWFWTANRCNKPAEEGNMEEVTRIVNGPAKLHLAERKQQYEVALTCLETSHG